MSRYGSQYPHENGCRPIRGINNLRPIFGRGYATPIIQPLAFGSFVARPRNTLASDLSMPCSWAAAMDIASPCPGTVSGAMNMWGNIGGAIAATVNGYLLRWFHGNWNTHG